jgi:hypothetical protein
MRAVAKLGVIAGGYAGAFLLAVIVVAVRMASTAGPAAQAASGMYAFGDLTLFTTVFAVAALLPTVAAVALFWSHPVFWMLVAGMQVTAATTSVAASLLFAFRANLPLPPLLATVAPLGVLCILAAPFRAFLFLLTGLLSTFDGPRRACLAAAVVEAGVSVFGVLLWLLPGMR